jgi:4a-hydroxytetrahydrobiopterin dehydratase
MDTILSDQEIHARLASLGVAWTAIGNDYLVRNFATKNFAEGVQLVNTIATIAEKQQHHPEVFLSYSGVELRVSTHSVAGITDKDFTFAAALDVEVK